MRKVIGAVFIIVSLVLAYVGVNKVSESSESVKLLGLKVEKSDDSAKRDGFIFLGLAVVAFIGGIYTFNKSSK